ncbi:MULTISPECIES: hypothetical protein [Pasteurella]|uniref:hypothetical protein n=1 Tax=Pasteurella TaxID=745 RepID=UPI0015D4CEE3|nr:hypothetical protein [Pasteurella multocida]HED4457172.1 hypothetical protein [Pasteurella multocida]
MRKTTVALAIAALGFSNRNPFETRFSVSTLYSESPPKPRLKKNRFKHHGKGKK